MLPRFLDRDKLDLDTVLAKSGSVPGEKRAFVAPAHGAQWTRRLANKALREYRKGRIDQALLWISHNESLTKLPWMWEYPVCIPFRRLRPCYFDDELETFPADQSIKLVSRGLPAANGSPDLSRQSFSFP